MSKPTDNQKQLFKPNFTPTERLGLFQEQDFYLYSKKFFTPFNIDIYQTKSLNYLPSNEALNEFNSDIMFLGLNNVSELYTDFNMNAYLEKDFMNCSMNTLYNVELPRLTGKFIIN